MLTIIDFSIAGNGATIVERKIPKVLGLQKIQTIR